ncbi:MAG TPA: TIGR03085 family metal-binding protein [Nocardioides sp.]|nr:TIGR03085 family metal-binding protein [Nocardioides sp.]
MTRMARTEREALCDLALQLGEDEPTLCGDWTVKELVVHLLVRERSPAAAGIVLKPLSRLTDLETRRLAARDFGMLVEKLRGGPPLWSPYAVPKLDSVFNTLEYFVHHEDIRRAQPDWEPRDLSDAEQKQLWSMVRTAGKGLVMRAPTGVAIENGATGSRVVLKAAAHQVVVHGAPSEITMFLFGRQDHARVELLGPDDATAALRAASLGF